MVRGIFNRPIDKAYTAPHNISEIVARCIMTVTNGIATDGQTVLTVLPIHKPSIDASPPLSLLGSHSISRRRIDSRSLYYRPTLPIIYSCIFCG